jgi:hypothetical protein
VQIVDKIIKSGVCCVWHLGIASTDLKSPPLLPLYPIEKHGKLNREILTTARLI